MTPTPIETSEEIERAASLWAVKDRPLSPMDDASLREWLAGDPRRRGALLRAQATWSSLSRARALGPSARWQGIQPSIIATVSRRRLLAATGALGGLMAAGVAGLIINRYTNETITRKGEIRRLPMSDGSIATINTESRIKIDMTDTQRRVDLISGEAWFKVAKNKERPFVVAAGMARVQAVGTAFSVNRRDGGAEVLVTEGTVKAWLDGADQQAVLLKAGDRTFMGQKNTITIEHAPEAIDSALAWREGQIALNGKSLSEAAAEYNRYNQIKIVIDDPDLASERLLGRFSTDDPDAFSSAVAQAFGAEIIRTDKAIYIGMKKK
ncbi:FecR family protein [Asticcacaulis sp. 201]|uniref:FecR family protein n=1 Tax=Asticcacaulis sp. 201 TaxID=3028787 RepID=UPI002917034C|nr:FecR domain-containing protein [Asticcacaulis sp. 201]MDV6331130.1 FecR domain-containing protein [Asticcacaulis sp. 201]